ncbi:NAD+ kinase [Nitratiruptor sp. YY08-26]|uniref:NAD(+)/NADH kinase n=1 Tax=unclassified Nitratiruptor TaxID=2624044 RepID=UPI0019159487|nr:MULTISPECIES: NAD(+)/NADH kinase [unclassified Nitratiruptor]BCD62125.1 NAD+ kinase [Nitratiruptor sp. YY08-13]BCD66061.1 NAD+ kinase [Nitratiruptor sp. YY08-26]
MDIKCAGIIIKPGGEKLKDTYKRIKKAFEKEDIAIKIDRSSAQIIGEKDGLSFDELCQACDILVSLGGDGTLISVARRSYEYHKPVLGINVGTLGFLTDIKPEDIESFVKKIKKNDFRIDTRMMIEIAILGKKERILSFNDVVITRPAVSKMIYIDVFIEDSLMNSYYGDGLIISTPTGSTAYNLSAGGPVVYPFSNDFIFTPICPHSLTQRPLVLPAEFEFKITTKSKSALIVIDGQDMYEFTPKDIVIVKKAPIGAKLIHRKERNYFNVLREKLGWGI